MRYILRALRAAACLFSLAHLCSTGEGMSLPPAGEITIRGSLNANCIPHNGGMAYLQIEMRVKNFPAPDICRRPMNIAVVLDRSGSMADDRKIDYAKRAINSLVDRMSSEDYLSVVIYDDQIEVLVPTQRMTDKEHVKQIVRGIYPRGSTNLCGGMVEGFRQIERAYKTDYVNRVILLSDGLANTGITDPREINRIADRYRNKSISLSTMGVGLEYNGNLMLGLAEHGGGNYYFIESPNQLASIFERELNGVAAVVAQNAHLELELDNGATIADVIGCEWGREGNVWVLPIGDLYAVDRREFTVGLHIPEGAGTRHLVTGVLKYEGRSRFLDKYPRFSVDIRYTDEVADLTKAKDWNVQAKVDVALSTRNVDRAIKALDAGNRGDARKALEEAKTSLLSSPSMANSAAGAPAMKDQIRQLEEFSRDLQDDTLDLRKTKKSIQYKNYQKQRGK